jgi:hypothetical protein
MNTNQILSAAEAKQELLKQMLASMENHVPYHEWSQLDFNVAIMQLLQLVTLQNELAACRDYEAKRRLLGELAVSVEDDRTAGLGQLGR